MSKKSACPVQRGLGKEDRERRTRIGLLNAFNDVIFVETDLVLIGERCVQGISARPL